MTSRGWWWSVLLAGAVGWAGYRLGQQRAPAPELEHTPETLVADAPTVLRAVRHMARLETVVYHLERVVDLKSRQRRLFGLVEADDSIVLIASGDVVAGVDLGRLQSQHVEITDTERRVRLTLPAPEILSARLDNQRTRVHSRSTDWLAERVESVETQARQFAEAEFRRAAIEQGILHEAQTQAARTLETLLHSLGFHLVEVYFEQDAGRTGEPSKR